MDFRNLGRTIIFTYDRIQESIYLSRIFPTEMLIAKYRLDNCLSNQAFMQVKHLITCFQIAALPLGCFCIHLMFKSGGHDSTNTQTLILLRQEDPMLFTTLQPSFLKAGRSNLTTCTSPILFALLVLVQYTVF